MPACGGATPLGESLTFLQAVAANRAPRSAIE